MFVCQGESSTIFKVDIKLKKRIQNHQKTIKLSTSKIASLVRNPRSDLSSYYHSRKNTTWYYFMSYDNLLDCLPMNWF